MNDLYRLLIIVLVLAVQHFLSTRDKSYWGIILPLLYLPTLVFAQVFEIIDWSILGLILMAIIGELFLLGAWRTGRKDLSNKRKKELEKMKTQDIR
jgi:hypothetical protein